ncbi:hypothetical protein ACOMHN_020336 [Nucella lapillus]
MPPSPLGATPRPHLRQHYPKPPEGAYLSEYEINTSVQSGHSKTKQSSSKTYSYTTLRPHQNSYNTVDSPLPDDYPAEVGRSTKSVVVIVLIFFLSLLAMAMVFLSLNPKSKA